MTVIQDVRFAGRMLLKDRWFTLVAAIALALGIGVNTTVFTFVNAVLIRGLPFDRPDEIVYLATHNATADQDDNSPAARPEFEQWRSKARSFTDLAAFLQSQMNVSDPDHPAERYSGASVTANTFGLLRQQPFLGRDFAAGEDTPAAPPVVIIGHQIWKNRYNSDPAVVGRSLKIGELSYTIIGVMPEGMRFPTNADIWRPLLPAANPIANYQRIMGVFGRLRPGVTWNQAAADMSTISRELQTTDPEHYKNIEARLMTFNERFNGGRIRLVFLSLLGAVGFVLLIACANVANLLLARSAYRAREMAVRTALGATRATIVRQLLIESVLLACLGGVLGLALTVVGVRLFDAAVADIGKPYWIRFTIDLKVFGYFAAVCLATGIIFGLAPALQVSKTNLNELMKEGGRGQAGGSRARWLTSSLVVAELTLTLVLLMGAGLMARSFLKLYSMNLGIETSQLLAMRTQLIQAKYPQPEQRQQFFATLRARLQSVQGISGAALASTMPLGGGGRFRFEVEGRPQSDPKTRPRVSMVEISPGYFDVSGIRLQGGRDFDERDGAPGGEVAIINTRLATLFFANDDPIGRRVRTFTGEQEDKPGAWFTVVGVSPTVRQGDVQALEPDAVMYQPYRVNSSTNTGILMRTSGEPASVIPAVREVVRSIDPEQPVYALQPLDDLVAGARYPYVVFGSLFVIFAVIALVLSAVGIYAIMAYSVTQRTQEIGVRLALGASPRQITWLILRGGLIQLAIGLVLGLMGAFGVTKLLASLVVQIPAADPVTFVVITTLMTIVTLAACLIPSRRATRLDPLAALRID